MTCTEPSTRRREWATLLRELAAEEGLVPSVRYLSAPAVAELRRAAFDLSWPLVFHRHTRRLESKKGHRRCAESVRRLDPACHDGFEDDVTAVVDYLFTYAKKAIANLDGWIASRIPAAVVDGHRKRRGRLGAQQRPRVPVWLITRLDEDPWLIWIAEHILEWVGVTATAGAGLWPLDAWTERRAQMTGQWHHRNGRKLVAGEINTVLTVMREANPDWYDRYVATPLGHKQAPVDRYSLDAGAVPRQPLLLVAGPEQDDIRLDELASAALASIERRITAGEDPPIVVREVVETVFLGAPTCNDVIDRPPFHDELDNPTVLSAMLADSERVSRLVEVVLDVIGGPSPTG